MRGGCWPAVLLILSACTDGDDPGHGVAEATARPALLPPPLPIVDDHRPQAYRPAAERSPFVSPQPETAIVPRPAVRDCIQPEPTGGELERYPLAQLSFRGTLGSGPQWWALVQVRDGMIHRVGVGQKLGVHHGEVIAITDHAVIVKEQVSDGAGCWVSRETRLTLNEEAKQQ